MRIALQPEQLQHRVERAALALVADLDALDVERDRAGVTRDVGDFGRIDKEDARFASMKRRISHGHATRSIFGRRRVTHRLGDFGAKRSSAAFATSGRPASPQA